MVIQAALLITLFACISVTLWWDFDAVCYSTICACAIWMIVFVRNDFCFIIQLNADRTKMINVLVAVKWASRPACVIGTYNVIYQQNTLLAFKQVMGFDLFN